MKMTIAMVTWAAVEDQEMPGRDARWRCPLEMHAQGVKVQNERATRSDSARIGSRAIERQH